MAAFQFGNCRLDPQARELRVDGVVVRVEPQVFDVLAYLVSNRDRMVSKIELLDAVWGSQFVSDSALTSRIKSARQVIGDDGAAQLLIRTQRGRGYRFVGPVDVVDVGPAPRPVPPWRPTGTLPPPRTPLIGRVDDLAALGRLLGSHRVVTVTGPGGAGKSTLALEAARSRAGGGGVDVAFVELAPVRDRAGVVLAVAETTGVEGAGADDVGVLANNLSARRLLLVLDNCEHLLDPCAQLVDRLLDAGPGAGVLATSREPLGVDGEAVHVIGSLGPDAATLFAQRATAATGRDTVQAGDPQVVELCERLDGLPLAIELAAAQMRHLTLGDLVSRLDDRLGILVGGRPRAGDRHATLATTIEWSHQLLGSAARELFEGLGVFPASFDLPAVEAIAGGRDPVAVTNAVGDLVGKNLVRHDPAGGRYRLLETIRLFAWHRLDASGRRAAVTELLRRHLVARVTAGTRPHAWLSGSLAARSHDDIENVRLAFDASIAAGRYGDAVDVMLGLSTLWRNAVSYAEGLRWASRLRQCDLADRDRMWLHIVEADLGLGSGDPRMMADAGNAAAAIGAAVDDPGADVIVTVYRSLSRISQPERAAAELSAASRRARSIGEPALDRLARSFRAVAWSILGRRDGLAAELRELTAAVSDGYDRYIAIWAVYVDALVARDGPALRRWMQRQADNIHGSGLRENWVTLFCDTLAHIADGGDYLPHLRRAIGRAEAEGRQADADCALALAYAAACQGDPVRAAEILGASEGGLFHDTANFVHHLVIRDRVVRPMLDATTFEAATARGSGLPIAQILADHQL